MRDVNYGLLVALVLSAAFSLWVAYGVLFVLLPLLARIP